LRLFPAQPLFPYCKYPQSSPDTLNTTRTNISTDSRTSIDAFKYLEALAIFSAASAAICRVLKAFPVAAPDPFSNLDNIDKVATDLREAAQLEALVDSTCTEILVYYFAIYPANTTKNYLPKQKK
jgi:hypothetical protein